MPRLKKTAHIFLDSNMLIHFAYADIDWVLVSNYQNVRIILAPRVISEMDKLKFDASERRLNRGLQFRGFINRVFGDFERTLVPFPNRKNTEIEVIVSPPSLGSYPHLSSQLADDEIIAAILDYQASNSLQDVFVVTDDTGMKFNAKRNGLSLLWHEEIERHRLPPEPSAATRQIKELKERISSLEEAVSRRAPEPELTIRKGNKEVKVLRIRDVKTRSVEEIEAQVRKELGAPPAPINENLDDDYALARAKLLSASSISSGGDIEEDMRYRKKLATYYKKNSICTIVLWDAHLKFASICITK